MALDPAGIGCGVFYFSVFQSQGIMPKFLLENIGPAAAGCRLEDRIQRWIHSQDGFVRRLLLQTAAMHGKRLRPRMVLCAAQACGKINTQVEKFAMAMEILHYATLVHDDVIDHADQRRHRPTLNQHYGNETAVLVGDLMFTQVMNILVRDIPEPVQKRVAQTAGQICLGELQEMQARSRVLNLEAYQTIIKNKTASLFSVCCEGGGLLAGATTVQANRLAAYGQAFGMAFQIQDDILDLTGQAAQVGKPVGSDLKDGRMTLPVILALQKTRGKQHRDLIRAVKSGRLGPGICQRLQACGALFAARAQAQAYALQAEQAAAGLKKNSSRDMFRHLARFAVEREN